MTTPRQRRKCTLHRPMARVVGALAVLAMPLVLGVQPAFAVPSGTSSAGGGSSAAASASPTSSGAAQQDALGMVAAKFALSQEGKPYSYGATGPYAYDCSGLTLVSWRAAGVTLPRTAAEQYYAGTHVPLSSLRPGDLVFWAANQADPSTIYHVAIAVAGNEVVQAPYTGEVVEQVPIWGAGLVTLATRP